jgi:hypothetical protein
MTIIHLKREELGDIDVIPFGLVYSFNFNQFNFPTQRGLNFNETITPLLSFGVNLVQREESLR